MLSCSQSECATVYVVLLVVKCHYMPDDYYDTATYKRAKALCQWPNWLKPAGGGTGQPWLASRPDLAVEKVNLTRRYSSHSQLLSFGFDFFAEAQAADLREPYCISCVDVKSSYVSVNTDNKKRQREIQSLYRVILL